MAKAEMTIGGMTPETVYAEAVGKGLAKADAAILVASWIYENYGKTQRTFNYAQSFDKTEPGCAPQFMRSFQHADWIDGESVVQAEQTAGEDGFNFRFHNIESDFDSLKQDVSNLFSCLAEMRSAIYTRFAELKTEINRINADIHSCCHSYQIPGYQVEPAYPPYYGLAGSGQFLGTIKYNDNYVSMWKTAQGYMMLPSVYTVNEALVQDPGIKRVSELAKYVAEDATIRRYFANRAVTKAEMVKKFGDVEVGKDMTLSNAVDILPDSAKYENIDAMLADLAEREASILRVRAGSDAAIASNFGVTENELESVRNAPIEKFDAIPEKSRIALVRAGIDTMEKLEKADSKKILEVLKADGIESGAGDVAGWKAVATTLNRIR